MPRIEHSFTSTRQTLDGIVAAGCPLGFPDFVQSEADSAADKVVQVIKRVLALPLSAQDKLLLLPKSGHVLLASPTLLVPSPRLNKRS